MPETLRQLNMAGPDRMITRIGSTTGKMSVRKVGIRTEAAGPSLLQFLGNSLGWVSAPVPRIGDLIGRKLPGKLFMHP